MAKRPAPKKSSLAGTSSIAPPQADTASQTPAPAPQKSEQEKPAPTEAGDGKKKTYPHKVSFYQDKADTDRLRGALLATQHHEGYRSMSAFITAAVMAEVHRLEQVYNSGQPFPEVSAKGGPLGRPMGE